MRFSAFLVLAVLATGCASRIRNTGTELAPFPEGTPLKELRKSGYWIRVEDPEGVRPFIHPVDVQKQYGVRKPLPPTQLADNETSRAIAFVVAPPTWTTTKGFPEDAEERAEDARNATEQLKQSLTREEEILFTIRERTYRYILRAYPHPVRVRYAYRESDPLIQKNRLITIEMRVVDIKRGDAWLRYTLGYGLGQSRIQIVGELFEGPERRKVGEFVIRRGHGGFSQSGLNTEVLRDDYTLKYAAEAGLRIIWEELPKMLPGVTIEPLEPGATQ